MEDNYNFFHSSSRICVKCCFGEIHLRFGIFWHPLKFSLKFNCHVINACFWLHNFIVKHRESTSVNVNMDECNQEVFNDDCRWFYAVYPEIREGVDGGKMDQRLDWNGNPDRGGCPLRVKAQSTIIGRDWRDRYRNKINRQQLVRPRTNWYWHRNRLMHGW